MSRKDTIIIAVLINAGLLIVLFACALKTSPPQADLTPPIAKYAEPTYKKEQPVMSGGDEVDQALALAATPMPSVVKETPIYTGAPAAPLPVMTQSSAFADD